MLLAGGSQTRVAAPGEKVYTEEDQAAAVREALAQAEEEATIVQMETEDLRQQLAVEREQNTQLTSVMEEYSAEITSLMKLKEGAREGESNKVHQMREQKEQVRILDWQFNITVDVSE